MVLAYAIVAGFWESSLFSDDSIQASIIHIAIVLSKRMLVKVAREGVRGKQICSCTAPGWNLLDKEIASVIRPGGGTVNLNLSTNFV